MDGTPDLNLLPLFITVAETANMSAAARKLGMPKSSVSRGIASLEESLGVQLFHRTTRQVSLTTAGSAFYERARPAIATVREALGSLPEQEEEPSGELRITAPVDMGLTFLPMVAAGFAARYPSVRLDVRPSNRRVDLVAEGYDVALRASTKLADSTLVARRLTPLEFHLFGSPSYVARRGAPRTLDELLDHDFVAVRSFPVLQNLKLNVRVYGDDLLFVRECIRAGTGIGVLPSFVAQTDVTSGQLIRLLPKWSSSGGSLFFVYPQTQHVPRKVSAFRDYLLEFLALRPLVPKT